MWPQSPVTSLPSTTVPSSNGPFTARLFPHISSSFQPVTSRPFPQPPTTGSGSCETPLPSPPHSIAPSLAMASGSDSPFLLPPPPPAANNDPPPAPSSFQPIHPAAPSPSPPPPEMPPPPGGLSPVSHTSGSTSGAGSISGRQSGAMEPALCSTCGQVHPPAYTHLYDYKENVDAEFLCTICRQPYVDPLDTKCGHTFCTPCLKNHLAVQALCPMDKQIINYLECQQASKLVKRLLDKLLVICPNMNYCDDVLPRCELEAHLKTVCPGAILRCRAAPFGCSFQGPRYLLPSHRISCQWRGDLDLEDGGGSNESLEGAHARIPYDHEEIIEGEVCTIEIHKKASAALGFSFVGGIDTPLMCIVVQEIYLDGVVAQDGRLRPGDQILEVNETILTEATHAKAKCAFSLTGPVCRITVYREKKEEAQPVDNDEILGITLSKRNGKKLGIKLAGRKNRPGLYVLGLVKGGEADLDGRLKKDDRILKINGIDLSEGTQDEAAAIIAEATESVSMSVARRLRAQTPDLIRTASGENMADCATMLDSPGDPLVPHWSPHHSGGLCRQREVKFTKEVMESMGMSVAGGVNSQRGDTPVYITNVVPDGCLGRTRQVKKGDILLRINNTDLLGLTHDEAVSVLIHTSQMCREVSLRLLEGPETSPGSSNFMPSWTYWLHLPKVCQMPRRIGLNRDRTGSLGFSIVGGNNCCIQIPSCDGIGPPIVTTSDTPQPIMIRSIVAGSPAHINGELKCGDILLSVNDFLLTDISHARAVTWLKHMRGDVMLLVVSWPGSIV